MYCIFTVLGTWLWGWGVRFCWVGRAAKSFFNQSIINQGSLVCSDGQLREKLTSYFDHKNIDISFYCITWKVPKGPAFFCNWKIWKDRFITRWNLSFLIRRNELANSFYIIDICLKKMLTSINWIQSIYANRIGCFKGASLNFESKPNLCQMHQQTYLFWATKRNK